MLNVKGVVLISTMYYEVLKTLIEDEFKISGFSEDIICQALDMLNELFKHEEKLSNSKEIVLVSGIAFLVLAKTDDFKNFREIADIFGTDAKKVALKSKEISLILNLDNFEELMTKGLSVLSFAQKDLKIKESDSVESIALKKNSDESKVKKNEKIEDVEKTIKNIFNSKSANSAGKEINDDEIIHLLKSYRKFANQLFKNKEYIEIKLFLKIFQSNLMLAGYEVKKLDIEEKFGNVFHQLGFEPKKGRDPEKFVKLKDRFGQSEPYSLIKLGE